MLSRFQLITVAFLLLLTGAVIGLLIFVANIREELQSLKASEDPVAKSLKKPVATESSTTAATPDLQASVSALSARVEALEQKPAAKTTPTINSAQNSSTLRKETLYLGSASTANREWVETGLEVVIDASDYPANTTVVYEAGLSIVGGEAWSRLKNKATGAIINISEVSHNGSTTIWKSSGAFKLHSGENRYAVELRSTSGETANLSGARLIVSW